MDKNIDSKTLAIEIAKILVGHPGLKQSRDGADGVALRDSAR